MSLLPGQTSLTLSIRLHRVGEQGFQPGGAIIVDSGVADAGSTPTWRIRNGNVLVLKTSTGRYVKASDTTGDRNAPATVTSLIALGAGTASKLFKYKYAGGVEKTVTMGGSDDTPAEVVAALNGDTEFARNLVASTSSSFLTITAKRAGAQEYFEITNGNINGQGGVANDTFADNTTAAYTPADYRVLEFPVDVQDDTGTACHALADRNALAGRFSLANLTNLTAEARSVLETRGSSFVA